MSTGSPQPLYDSMETEAIGRVKSYLRMVSRGNPTDYRSPLFGRTTSREDILELVDNFAYSGVVELDELENSERGKVGPYSIRLPWEERRNSLDEYFNNPGIDPDLEALDYAMRQVLYLIPHTLQPLSFESSFSLMPRGTNLGLPLFSRRRADEKWYLNEARRVAALRYPIGNWYPSVIGWRGQPRGLYEIPKQRNVWMCSHVETIIGRTIVDPVVSALRKVPEFAAWNPLEVVDLQITHMFNNATQPLLSIDFKSFDQSISRTLVEQIFLVLRLWYPESESRKLAWLQEFFLTSGILDPDGLKEGRNGSVPSGSSNTNLMDSLVHILAVHYIARRIGNTVRDLTVLGDDGVWSFNDTYELDEIVLAAAELGLTVSPEKSGISDVKVHFLQRLHLSNHRTEGISRGMRSVFRTVGSMISFERFRDNWKPEYNTVRWIMQVENCVNHPQFPELVAFLFDGDKLLHELDPARIFKAAGGAEAAKSFLNLKSFPYKNASPDRFDTFKTVREIREIQQKERSVALA